MKHLTEHDIKHEIIKGRKFNFCTTYSFFFFFLFSFINGIHGQTTYRKSVSFSGFTSINIDQNQNAPKTNKHAITIIGKTTIVNHNTNGVVIKTEDNE
jgi:hypothetical protein